MPEPLSFFHFLITKYGVSLYSGLYSNSVKYTPYTTASVVQWSEFLATDPETRVRFPALPEKKVMSLERGPLSLVSTTEELLDRKVSGPV
jgi:hypothetical protein